MRASVASLTKKLISTFFAGALVCGLMPATALAENSTSVSADGIGTVPNVSDVHEATGNDSQGEFAETGFILSDGEEETQDSAMTGDTSNPDITSNDVINQEMPLNTVIAQAESTKSFFLAQTLESTRTIPVVSAQLPMDTSQGNGSSEDEENKPAGEISSESTVVGSFEYLGMTFAIEADGASVALVAGDYNKLPQESIEKQIIVIPDSVTPDGIDAYSVTRIADDAFAGFTKENANPDYTGCEALFSDEELLEEAGVEPVDLDEDDPLAGCTGILALGIPASVTTIEDEAFSGFDTLQYIVVSEDNQNYASYDGALYSADLANLRLIPEGRVGTIRVAPSATTADPEVFSHCPSVDTVVADPESGIYVVLEAQLSNISINVIAPKAENAALFSFDDYSDLQERNAYSADTWYASFNGDGGTVIDNVSGNGVYTIGFAPGTCAIIKSGDSCTQVHFHQPLGTFHSLSASRTGYAHVGWKGPAPSEAKVQAQTEVTNGQTYTALWEPRKYAVSFNVNGGSGGQTANVTATYNAAMPPISTTAPTRGGYRFDGWYDTSASTGGTKYYNANGTSAHVWDKPNAASLYARWTENDTWYASFDGNGGSVKNTTTGVGVYTIGFAPHTCSIMKSGDKYTAIHFHQPLGTFHSLSASRTGYAHAGWKGPAPSEAKVQAQTEITHGQTFTALWDPLKYTVSFNVNGGSGGQSANVTATYDAAMPPISTTAPTRDGYRFDGWYDTSASTGGTQYYTAAGASARTWNKTANTTLYARWLPNTYTVNLSVNGTGASVSPTTIAATYDANITLPTPSRSGHDFLGWNTEEDGSGTAYAAGTTKNLTKIHEGAVDLHAQWRVHVLTVSWQDRGATLDSVSRDYGTTVAMLGALPERPAYTFEGWRSSIDGAVLVGGADYTVPDRNTVFAAVWKLKPCAVVFDPGTGAENISVVVPSPEPESSFAIPAPVRKEGGEVFSHWGIADDDETNLWYAGGSLTIEGILAGGYPEADVFASEEIDGITYHNVITLHAVWTPTISVSTPLVVTMAIDPDTGEMIAGEGYITTTGTSEVSVLSLAYDKTDASSLGGGTDTVFGGSPDGISLTMASVRDDVSDIESAFASASPFALDLGSQDGLPVTDSTLSAFPKFGNGVSLRIRYGLAFPLGFDLSSLVSSLPDKADTAEGSTWSRESYPIANLYYTVGLVPSM